MTAFNEPSASGADCGGVHSEVAAQMDWSSIIKRNDLSTEQQLACAMEFIMRCNLMSDFVAFADSDQQRALAREIAQQRAERAKQEEERVTLSIRRELAATKAYMQYGVGSQWSVEDCSGWEWSSASQEWSRAVFLKRTHDANDDAPTVKGRLVVVFVRETAEVISAVMTVNGAVIGTPMESIPA